MSQHPAQIDGLQVTTEDPMVITAPYDGAVIGEVPRCGSEHVDRAVAAAKRVMVEEPLPAWRRAEVLDRAAEIIATPEVHADLARTIALEAAKPIATAEAEVDRCVSTFRFSAAVCRQLVGEMLPLDAAQAGEGRLGFTLRVPVGVVGAIAPFNFPLNLVAHKVAPAIAAGCAVVLKPAHQTPFSALKLAELLTGRCGLPPAWLSTVTGPGSKVGAALVDHPDVGMITFTGSPEVGWRIRASAPSKRVSLELGNNAPVIIEPDADFDVVAAKVAAAGYSHAGQSCISVQRVLIHEEVADRFLDALSEAVEALVVGDPLDPATQVSTVIDVENRDRVHAWVEEAIDGGARLICGGTVREDGVLSPTVLADADLDAKVCREEVFGPVVSVNRYRDIEEAFSIANDTKYGLHAGIFTSDLAVAKAAMLRLDFGGIIINDVPTWRADQMPYGGVRDSGNTREGPAYTVQEMTELRSVVIS